MINDLVLILLWGIPCVAGSVVLIPMLMNPIINLINDIYGIINWRKLEKTQKITNNSGKFRLIILLIF